MSQLLNVSRPCRHRQGLALAVVLTLVSLITAHAAEPPQEVADLKALIDRAAVAYRQGDFRQSGNDIQRAMVAAARLIKAGDPDAMAAAQSSVKRLTRAHELLLTKGIKLPPLPTLVTSPPGSAPPVSAPAASSPPGSDSLPAGSGAPPVASAAAVSFTGQVAPLIAARCGGCHIRNARGELSMASYAALMRGGKGGPVVVPGNPDESPFWQLIEAGKMPPKGALSVQQRQVLRDWIAAGAPFDGDDPEALLAAAEPENGRPRGFRSGFGPGGPPPQRGGAGRPPSLPPQRGPSNPNGAGG